MKRMLAIVLSLVMIFAVLAGCTPRQTNHTAETLETTATEPSEEPGTEPSTEGTTPGTDKKDPNKEEPNPPIYNEEPIFTYDKYMVTADARDAMSEREYMLYCRAIDSILAHDGVVAGFESQTEFYRVWRFLFSEFIPMRVMIQSYLQSDEPFLYEDGTATFKFIGDKETCDQNYAKFEKIMNEALALIHEDDSDWERIAKLYLYVSEHMVYGSVWETHGVNADFYNSIIYKVGMCSEYAYYLNMLANQIGFETIAARSLGKDGFVGADHCWSMIHVDGQWYHFDACWQAPLWSHENLDYFAISTQERYDSLATNNIWGQRGELDMYYQHDYTYERTELPICENAMSQSDRRQLYLSVIGEYTKDLARDVPDDMLESYIDAAISKVQEAISNGATIGIKFEIKNGTTNVTVKNLILNYSPQDLEDYPMTGFEHERCNLEYVVLKHIDQRYLRDIMYFIIKDGATIGQSVELVVL